MARGHWPDHLPNVFLVLDTHLFLQSRLDQCTRSPSVEYSCLMTGSLEPRGVGIGVLGIFSQSLKYGSIMIPSQVLIETLTNQRNCRISMPLYILMRPCHFIGMRNCLLIRSHTLLVVAADLAPKRKSSTCHLNNTSLPLVSPR